MAKTRTNVGGAAPRSGKRKRGSPYAETVVPKISPRLRMFADGDQEVNALRCGFVPSLAIARDVSEDAPEARVRDLHAAAEGPKPKRLGRLTNVATNVEASVFITQTPKPQTGTVAERAQRKPEDLDRTPLVQSARQRGTLTSGRVKISDLAAVAALDGVLSVELAEGLRRPKPRVARGKVAAPRARDRHVSPEGGRNVLVGIIDVGGFDFAHDDFLDRNGQTRFLEIWDQGGSHRGHPKGFDYGARITRAHMNAAIAQASGRGGIAATAYEPQSQMEEGSHGTHVASIAAGNRGVCHRADIAAVLIDVGDQLDDHRLSFYDSTRLADAVDWLVALAQEQGRPVSINVSLGTNGHAHDGSSAVSRWVDAALAVPGRAVCVAAGNAGQESPQSDDDLGFLFGRIHTSGRIAAKGLTTDIEWLVVGSGMTDISENELEIWYGAADRFGVQVKPPDLPWTDLIEPGEYIENRQLPDGSLFSVYNELYHPANGANYLAIYLSPFLSDTTVRGVRSGTWRIRLKGIDIRDGRFDGWIERDDPQRPGGGSYWAFPSVFSETSNVDRSSVSSLACGHQVVSVANLDSSLGRINVSSSQGPTRDARSKPEIAAPGTDVVAACGFQSKGNRWIAMSGTSMASPYVTGVVGLMLSLRRDLTAAQILGIIQRTAQPLAGDLYDWRNDAGYGAIDPEACLAEAKRFTARKDVT
jgi:subtilisin family serine protease